MIAGMQHCGGGPGATNIGQSDAWPDRDPQHNARVALEDWVEKGTAPVALTATKTAEDDPVGAVTMTRLICPYPQSAKYKGGDPNRAESFVCKGGGR